MQIEVQKNVLIVFIYLLALIEKVVNQMARNNLQLSIVHRY
jgi:hypothetical protein